MRLFSVILGMYFLLSGCAESSSGTPDVSAHGALPERPEQSGEIFNRDLLFKNDPRVSYCEIIESQTKTYSGMRDTELQPLASLSKVITSAWALEKLGADFRFSSEIFLNPVQAGGLYDVYLKTNYDPIVNIEKLLYLMAQMNQAGVRQIRHLVIDESTRIYLGVLSNPHTELTNTPISTNETVENLRLIFNSKNWAEKTRTAKANVEVWARSRNINLTIPNEFAVASVGYKPSSEIVVSSYATKLKISSAPLFKYLKNINVSSNNYVSDSLFAYLGGASAFKKFQTEKLRLDAQSLQVYTGSGLSVSSSGFRQDNLGTCFSMIRVLGFLKNKAYEAQLNLGALLLNPSLDQDGTFDTHSKYQNAVVLKTGRLYEVPALNLAGYVSTSRGMVSFVFLGHDFTEAQAKVIEDYRSRMLDDIYSQYPVRADFSSIDYAPIFF